MPNILLFPVLPPTLCFICFHTALSIRAFFVIINPSSVNRLSITQLRPAYRHHFLLWLRPRVARPALAGYLALLGVPRSSLPRWRLFVLVPHYLNCHVPLSSKQGLKYALTSSVHIA